MVPDGWRIKTLGEIATLERGFDLPHYQRADGEIPVFAANGQIGRHDRAKVRGPGVITGRNGTIGKVTFTDRDFWPLNTTFYVKEFHGNHPPFVGRLLESLHLEQFATGTGIPTLNRHTVHAQRVIIPPLAEQVRIAHLCDLADAAIAASDAVLAQARRVQQGMEQQLLTCGVGHTHFQESPLGKVPLSWRVTTLSELCTLRNGHAFSTKEWSEIGLPIIRIQNLRGSDQFKRFAGFPAPSWRVEPGDLLFAWAGTKESSLGPYRWTGPPGVLNQHIFHVAPARGIDPLWLFKVLERLTRQIEQHLTRGFKESLQHFRKTDLTTQWVAVPPPHEQRLIARHCEKAQRAVAAEKANLDCLLELKQNLLRELLSGKVRFGDLPRSKQQGAILCYPSVHR